MASLCKVCCDIFPEHILTSTSGITGGFGVDRRVEYIIPHKAREEGYHEFVIESSCNGMFGVPWNGDTIQPPDVYLPPTIHSSLRTELHSDESLFYSCICRSGSPQPGGMEPSMGF